MVEIALYDNERAVEVEPRADGVIRVKIGPGQHSEHIAEVLHSNGLSEHVREAVDLFGNDSVSRKFENFGDYVLITADSPNA